MHNSVVKISFVSTVFTVTHLVARPLRVRLVILNRRLMSLGSIFRNGGATNVLIVADNISNIASGN